MSNIIQIHKIYETSTLCSSGEGLSPLRRKNNSSVKLKLKLVRIKFENVSEFYNISLTGKWIPVSRSTGKDTDQYH